MAECLMCLKRKSTRFCTKTTNGYSACMDANLPFLGLCQGTQQIARILGASVGPTSDNRHEFGYYEVTPTTEAGSFLTDPIYFTQAHFHTFDLPQGAVHLARSAGFENQAFRHGENVYGLQFHPKNIIALWKWLVVFRGTWNG